MGLAEARGAADLRQPVGIVSGTAFRAQRTALTGLPKRQDMVVVAGGKLNIFVAGANRSKFVETA